MLQCPKCENNVNREHNFCSNCGFPVQGLFNDAEKTKAQPTGERRHITVIFCDLVGSTRLSGQLDPEDLRDLMHHYQRAAAEAVTDLDGFVAKFLGDGLLAFFGFPHAHEDDAERAVRAGLDIIKKVAAMKTPDGESLAVRVGISTGLVVVGDILAAGAASEQSVIGETPNLAARLQELAPNNGIVVSGATQKLLGQGFEFKDLGAHELKGFTDPVACFQILGERRTGSRFQASRIADSGFFGRGRELSLMQQHWIDAQSGKGRGLLISGEAGVGKSRLSEQLTKHIIGTDGIRIRFQSSRYHENTEFFPLTQHLRYAARLDATEPAARQLEKLDQLMTIDTPVPRSELLIIGELLGIDSGGEAEMLSPERRKKMIMDLFCSQIITLSRRKPVVVLFEDLHWADASSLEFIRTCRARVAEEAVLMLLTTRPESSAHFSFERDFTTLNLSGLEQNARIEMILDMAGENNLPLDMVDMVVARTDGIPLYLEELVNSLLHSKDTSAGAPASDTVPDSLQALFMERLDRLGPARELAQAASIIGRQFERRLVAKVVDLIESLFDEYLAQLLEADLIRPSGHGHEQIYEFKHALVQETAYGNILRSRRRTLHGRVADLLSQELPDIMIREPELLARHYQMAHRPDDAFPHFCRAAEKAAKASANLEAVSHFSAALELLPQIKTKNPLATELKIRAGYGVALIANQGYASAQVVENYNRAREIGGTHEGSDLYFTAVRGLWNYHFDRGDLITAQQYAEDLQALSDHGDRALRQLFYHRNAGTQALYQGALQQARHHLESAINGRRQASDHLDLQQWAEDPGLVSMIYFSWAHALTGDVSAALTSADQAVQRVRDLDHPLSLGFALGCQAFVYMLVGLNDPAQDILDEGLKVSRDHKLPFWEAWANISLGFVQAIENGDSDGQAAISQLQAGMQAWADTGAGLHLPTQNCLLMAALLCHGRLDEAEKAGATGLAVAARFGENMMQAELLRLHGQLAEAREDFAGALEFYQQAVDVADRQGADLFALKAQSNLYALGGREQAAVAWAEKGLDQGEIRAALVRRRDQINGPDTLPLLITVRGQLNEVQDK